MWNLILAALLLVNCLILLVVVYAIFKVKAVSSQVKAFITPVSADIPSEFAKLTDTISSVFARSITAQIKTTLMGIQSGQVRNQKALEGDIAEGIAESTPIGAALTSIPAVRKALRHNPGLIDIAMNFLNGPGKGSNLSGNNGSKEQVQFKF
jgi:hypothetical protein